MSKHFGRRLVLTVLPVCAAMFFVPAVMAATVTVNTSTDEFGTGSGCSLREAIKSVDGVSGGAATGTDFGGCVASGSYATSADPPDTIMVPAGTYQLNLSAGSPEDNDASGDLDVFRSMTIVGTGNPTIQQTVAGSRVLDVTATGKTLSLSGLTITGGDQAASDGGGIHFRGGSGSASLSLNGVTVTGNDAARNGAGIFTDSATTITDSVITDNHTLVTSGLDGNGGGIYQDGSTDSFTGVSLVLDHSSVTGNSGGDLTNFGSGGGIYRITKAGDNTSTGMIEDSEISGNTGHFFGGGIYNQSDSSLDVDRSLISGNHALGLRGGGIAADSQTLSAGHLNLRNTTVTGNTSSSDGGGIKAGGITGVINVSLLFSTIAGNTGQGSEFNFSGNSGAKPTYEVEGTIFAATDPNLADACRMDGTNYVNRTDDGYNISTDPTDTTTANATGNGCGLSAPLADGDHTGVTGTLLNPLADNGGPTKTMEPTASSFAVDNTPNSVCTTINPAVTTDQRGFARPEVSGGNCDSGAYEVQSPVLTSIGGKSVAAGQLLSFTVSAADLDPADTLVFSATNLPPGATFDPGTRTFAWTPGAAQVGNYPNVHFSVTDGFSSDAEDIGIAVTTPPPPAATTGSAAPAPPAKKKCKKHKKSSAAAAKKCKKKKKK